MDIFENFIVKFTQNLEILVYKFPWAYGLLNKYYTEIVDNEIKLANISKNNKILCIGGGPCPFTAIELHRKTGAKVLVIDNDYDAAKFAKLNIKKMNLSTKIKVCHYAGEEFCCKDFDVVHVALQVYPKERVFKQIIKSCNLGTKILIRCPKTNLENFYSNVTESIFPANAKIYHKGGNTEHTSLYMKTGGGYEKALEKSNCAIINYCTY